MIKSLPIYKIGVLVSIENSFGVGRKTFGDYITNTTNSEFLFFLTFMIMLTNAGDNSRRKN